MSSALVRIPESPFPAHSNTTAKHKPTRKSQYNEKITEKMKEQTGKSWYLSSVPVTVPESPFPNTTAKHKPTKKKRLVERKNN